MNYKTFEIEVDGSRRQVGAMYASLATAKKAARSHAAQPRSAYAEVVGPDGVWRLHSAQTSNGQRGLQANARWERVPAEVIDVGDR